MGSQGGGGGGGGVGGGTHTQNQDPKSNGLARQGSLYTLTLDEVQNQLGHLGKPLTSMNLDELLRSVYTAEATSQRTDFGQVQHASCQDHYSGDLSKKTVDEVWHDIQQGEKRSSLDRKATLGEMTLEDFLIKAGIVSPGMKNSGPVLAADSMALLQLNAQWPNYHIQNTIQQQHNMLPVFMTGQQNLPVVPNPMMDTSYSEQMTISPTLMGAMSDTQGSRRKRTAPETVVEKSVERRQKRMIKNRESAARSRARKQAYTQELESKVSHLEEENDRLKKQKEKDKLLPYVRPQEPKYQLRRTSSSPF
ncbi:unnamed protein product [Cuscuta europaea]|uniref:BZIP domain-containing protein n=1 Tax=Cuscuta europaea TaxID=41803 RepID=A0A9P0YJR7_CUSEU|nr:unnamed protein product [Cuscuta europaea]